MQTPKSFKLCVIGGGSMGSAIISGLLSKNFLPASRINVSNPHVEKMDGLAKKGVNIFTDNKSAVRDTDVVILAVKPWKIGDVIAEISEHTLPSAEICSLAAGISSRDIFNIWNSSTLENLSIVMPNTAVRICESMTFLVEVVGNTDKTRSVFEALGTVMTIDESQLTAATSLASCGIAFAMRYIRAACEGGVELGFPAQKALEIVCQTITGAADLLKQPGAHPEVEIDKVTTPGGFTIRGLNTMEKFGFSNSVIEGLKACKS